MATTTLPRGTRLDMSEETRTKVVSMLEPHMHAAIDLALQMKQAHWNVRGPSFIGLHELFDKIVDIIRLKGDEIAERIVQLGGEAVGTADCVAEGSYLPKFPQGMTGEENFVKHVSNILAAFGKGIREGIDDAEEHGDQVTMDMLIEVGTEADKYLWFVESHLG